MTSQPITSTRSVCTFVLYPVRPFDSTWDFNLWGWSLLGERSGPFKVPDPDDPSETVIIERLELRGEPGYDAWFSTYVAPSELLDGLTDQEPFTDDDKSLLLSLRLARVVDGVFRPDWRCLQSYLVAVCGVPEQHLPGLYWRDILRIIRADRSEAVGKSTVHKLHDKAERPVLTDLEQQILFVFEERETRTTTPHLMQTLAARDIHRDDKTVKAAVRYLLKLGLIERPQTPDGRPTRKGSAISAAGKRYLATS